MFPFPERFAVPPVARLADRLVRREIEDQVEFLEEVESILLSHTELLK